jgi:putative hydrolase
MNEDIAKNLREIADLLGQQNANPFRVNAYRRAANTIESINKPLQKIIDKQGIAGLTALPGIGEGIARSIYEYVTTGKMTRLEALRGENDPISLFAQIPGIGNKLAKEIHEELHVDTLEALEIVAHNGRLEKLPKIGKARVASIQNWLSNTLGKRRYQAFATKPLQEPSVVTLLEIDQRYRKAVAQNKLPKITPKRFNPEGKAWLPIFHTTRGEWHFTAMFSNTLRAHELGQTHDWVVVYYYDQHHHEGQNTVVTETRGPLIGKRVVRGREQDCKAYYSHELAI